MRGKECWPVKTHLFCYKWDHRDHCHRHRHDHGHHDHNINPDYSDPLLHQHQSLLIFCALPGVTDVGKVKARLRAMITTKTLNIFIHREQKKKHTFENRHTHPFGEDLFRLILLWSASYPGQKCDPIVIGVCRYKCDPAALPSCSRAIIMSSNCCDELILSVWAPNIVIAIWAHFEILWLLWADVVVITRRCIEWTFRPDLHPPPPSLIPHLHPHNPTHTHTTCW